MERAFRVISRSLVGAALLSFGLALWRPNLPARAMFLGLALLDCSFLVMLWRSFLLRLPLRRRYGPPLTYDANRASYIRVHVALTLLAAVILFALSTGVFWDRIR